jgi:hypothetical protein
MPVRGATCRVVDWRQQQGGGGQQQNGWPWDVQSYNVLLVMLQMHSWLGFEPMVTAADIVNPLHTQMYWPINTAACAVLLCFTPYAVWHQDRAPPVLQDVRHLQLLRSPLESRRSCSHRALHRPWHCRVSDGAHV